MATGKSLVRVDAVDKVTGRAKYTDDLVPVGTLVARVLHSTIANGKVLKVDTSKAEALQGVEAIFTCFDVPDIQFPTAGHPWSTDPSHQDVADRKLLNERVRYYGDDVAVVVAENEVIAQQALDLIEVEYEEYEPLMDIDAAMNSTGVPIHDFKPNNVLVKSNYNVGDKTFDEVVSEGNYLLHEDVFDVPTVQHCFMENANSYAYMENSKIVVVSSTQIPHICRRVVGQALGIPWGQVRVIKPYIGGGFGGKQDVLYEPLNAWVCQQLGGRAVKLELSREESFLNTRVRHAMRITLKSALNEKGELIARYAELISDQGAYASHGHSVVAGAAHITKMLYQDRVATTVDFITVYTNKTVGGAMRGYGVPQITFALESHMDNISRKFGFDSIELRKKNMIYEGFVDPLNTIPSITNELPACIETGAEYLDYRRKLEEYKDQTGEIRKGVGMAIFSYKTGVYPISLETATVRVTLNQDGSIQVVLGATEIGQGADTVFSQMAAEIVGVSMDKVHLVSTQDTDLTPYDSGAYASRQSYVSGHAVKKAAIKIKKEILEYCNYLTGEDTAHDIQDNIIVDIQGKDIMELGNLAVEAQYHRKNSKHISAEVTHHCDTNTISHGVTFCEVEVDMKLGKVKVLDIINVHDSGKILNPALALGQVHGGVSMGLGYALSEELLYDEKGKPYNGNLLGYKLQTALDTPNITGKFIEKYDESAPFGNKALGEPPTVPVAPAIRNAIVNATGVEFNQIPITAERVFNKLKEVNHV